jgi:hypothetical protein
MQVFIVKIESIYDGSSHWHVDRVFNTMQAAKDYIANRKAEYRGIYDIPEFDIDVEQVCGILSVS